MYVQIIFWLRSSPMENITGHHSHAVTRSPTSSSILIRSSYERALSRYQQDHTIGNNAPMNPRIGRFSTIAEAQSESIAKRMQDHYKSFAQKGNDNNNYRAAAVSQMSFDDQYVPIEQKPQPSTPQPHSLSPSSSSFSPSQVYDQSTITLEDILNTRIPSNSAPVVKVIDNTDVSNGKERTFISPKSAYIDQTGKSFETGMSNVHNPHRLLEVDDEAMVGGYELDDDTMEPLGPYEVSAIQPDHSLIDFKV